MEEAAEGGLWPELSPEPRTREAEAPGCRPCVPAQALGASDQGNSASPTTTTRWSRGCSPSRASQPRPAQPGRAPSARAPRACKAPPVAVAPGERGNRRATEAFARIVITDASYGTPTCFARCDHPARRCRQRPSRCESRTSSTACSQAAPARIELSRSACPSQRLRAPRPLVHVPLHQYRAVSVARTRAKRSRRTGRRLIDLLTAAPRSKRAPAGSTESLAGGFVDDPARRRR